MVDVHVDWSIAGLKLVIHRRDSFGGVDFGFGRFNKHFFFLFVDVEHLVALASVAVYGDSFAAGVPCHQVGFLDVFNSSSVWQVDCFRNTVVRVFLEGSLVFDVVFDTDVVRACEHFLDALRDFLDSTD